MARSKKLPWDKIIPQAVEQAQEYYDEYGDAGTLRAIYYRLVSIEAIPNTHSAYKGLSRELTKARLDGRFPWRLLQDKTRKSTGRPEEFALDKVLRYASAAVEDELSNLIQAFSNIQDPEVRWSPSRWDGQDKRVIVAIEKEAIMGAVKSVLKGWGVEICPLKGYASTTFVKKIAESIKRLNEYGQVQLIIVTDYDPSGEDMVRDLQQRLYYDYGAQCEAEKVLLTKEQIRTYDLPAIPKDAQEMAKMQRDPRFNKWEDGFFRVELDAMAAIKPQAFREIIKGSVSKHFDMDLYEDRQFEGKQACEDAEEELRDLYEQLKDVHERVLIRIDEIQGDL